MIDKEPSPIVKKIEAEMGKISKESRGTGVGVEHTGPKEAAETFPGKASQIFTPDVDFWEINREEMIEELAQNIYDIRMSQNSEITKAIPEIGLDLSGPYIDWMLINMRPRVTPGTEKAERFMRRWDRIQAEKWLKYLENQKKGGRAEKGEKPAAIEPAPKPRPAEALPKPKPEEIELGKKKTELNEEQKKILDDLMERAGIDKITSSLEEKYKQMDAESAKGRRGKNKEVIQNIRDVFTEMITSSEDKFSKDDLKYFEENFFNPKLIESYKSARERKKITRWEDLKKHRDEFVEFMEKMAKENNYSADGVELIKSYFRSVLLLEMRLLKY